MSQQALRVLHVIPGVAPRYGGPTQAVLGMVRALKEEGLRAELVTTDADGPSERLQVELGCAVEYRGVTCRFFARDWGEALKYSRGLAEWLAANVDRYHVVHVHAVFSHACVEAGRAARRSAVPYVVRPLGTLEPWSMGQRPLRKRLFWWFAARRLLSQAAAVHYTGERERRETEAGLSLTRGRVIPLGVDPAPAPRPATDPPYVLALGRLHPKKRLELLVDAFSSLTRQGRAGTWELWIAGTGEPEYEAWLRGRARARCAGRVRFLGWIEGEEKATILGGASLVALPSRQENFGIAVAEAMAAGVPVLVSPEVDLASEVSRVGAGWVVVAEEAAVAGALEEIIRAPGERTRRGLAGRELVAARYTWRAVARELMGLYGELARTAGRLGCE